LLVAFFNDDTRGESSRLASELRAAGVNTELYFQDKTLGKQFNYADKKRIPLVAVLGPEEVAAGMVKLKRLSDGAEVTVSRGEAGAKVREMLG
jgi:histidyl-tRNA synthetase